MIPRGSNEWSETGAYCRLAESAHQASHPTQLSWRVRVMVTLFASITLSRLFPVLKAKTASFLERRRDGLPLGDRWWSGGVLGRVIFRHFSLIQANRCLLARYITPPSPPPPSLFSPRSQRLQRGGGERRKKRREIERGRE